MFVLAYLLLRPPGNLADSLDMWYERYGVGGHFQLRNLKSPTVSNNRMADVLAREWEATLRSNTSMISKLYVIINFGKTCKSLYRNNFQ